MMMEYRSWSHGMASVNVGVIDMLISRLRSTHACNERKLKKNVFLPLYKTVLTYLENAPRLKEKLLSIFTCFIFTYFNCCSGLKDKGKDFPDASKPSIGEGIRRRRRKRKKEEKEKGEEKLLIKKHDE